MHIEYTDEQNMLRDSVDKYLRDNYSFVSRQAVAKSGEGFSEQQWRTFAELGWLAMTLPEEHGGFEGGALETMILCEAFGKHLVLEPYMETVVLTAGLLQEAGPGIHEKYLAGVAEGRVQGALAALEAGRQSSLRHVETRAESCAEGFKLSGSKCTVFNGPAADVFLVTARTSGDAYSAEGISLFAVDAGLPGLSRRDYPTYDGRHASELWLDGVTVPEGALVGEPGRGYPVLEKIIDRALLALSAEAVGAMDSLLAATVEYTKQRKQFGKPISRFQVLRHRMADMFMEIELTRSLMLATAYKLDQNADDASALVSALKAKVGKSGPFVGQNAIQLHGGIGMTEELSVGHYFKRIAVIENLFNSRDFHLQRYMRLTCE